MRVKLNNLPVGIVAKNKKLAHAQTLWEMFYFTYFKREKINFLIALFSSESTCRSTCLFLNSLKQSGSEMCDLAISVGVI